MGVGERVLHPLSGVPLSSRVVWWTTSSGSEGSGVSDGELSCSDISIGTGVGPLSSNSADSSTAAAVSSTFSFSSLLSLAVLTMREGRWGGGAEPARGLCGPGLSLDLGFGATGGGERKGLPDVERRSRLPVVT